MTKRHKHKRTKLTLHRVKGFSKPGTPRRHITMEGEVKGTEYSYHATKGYRSAKVQA